MLRNEHLSSFLFTSKILEKYIDKFKNNTCNLEWYLLLYRQR